MRAGYVYVKGQQVRSSTAFTVRRVVLWLSLAPIAATAFVLLVVLIGGHMAGPDAGLLSSVAWGAGFLVFFVPVLSAHLAAIAVVTGVSAISLGLRADYLLGIALLLATTFSGFVLSRIYTGFLS
jgi:hypothetical protein